MISKILAGVAAIAAASSVAAAENSASSIYGKWRITRAVIAPWSAAAGAGEMPAWLGASVAFSAARVKGPGPIGCANANYEATDNPPQGLFQGGLPEPADKSMSALGLAGASVAGVSLSCDTGIFEYHYADADTLLLALDNRVWTLDRTAGTRASKNSPEGVLQRFLEAHFAGDMSFTPEAVGKKRGYFSGPLVRNIDGWFEKPQSADEALEINGDPFTDSQEYPTRFAVGADDKKAAGVEIPVEYADAFAKRSVIFVMTREKSRWLIGDIKYEDGSMFTGMLTN